jgi:hypothetical protein
VKSGTSFRLILGDQLNSQHSWFRQVRADILYTLMEVRQETDVVSQHIQKLAGFLSAMRHFADDLSRAGHRVVYLRLDDPKNEHSFEANLIRLIREHRITRFEYMQPDDYRLDGDRQYAGNEPICRWGSGGHQALYLLGQLYPQDERLLRSLSLPVTKNRGRACLPLQQLLLGLYPSPSAVAGRQSPCRNDGSDLGSDAGKQAG